MTQFFGEAHHIQNKKHDGVKIAKTVLLPGDPLRAKWIAETFLENAKQFNSIRNMFGYTGTYKGEEVSVMGSGMGVSSAGIYIAELYGFYNVENIIRVGTAGSISPDIAPGKVIIGLSASTDTGWPNQYGLGGVTYCPSPSSKLLHSALKAASNQNIDYIAGQLFSSTTFYSYNGLKTLNLLSDLGCLAVEMEAYALYAMASEQKKHALAIVTVSDAVPVTGMDMSKMRNLTAEERQSSLKEMVLIALECALDS